MEVETVVEGIRLNMQAKLIKMEVVDVAMR